MGLDLWFRDDVARILASAFQAMHASTGAVSPASQETARTYRQGFVDALSAVAVAFGVTAPDVGSAGFVRADPRLGDPEDVRVGEPSYRSSY